MSRMCYGCLSLALATTFALLPGAAVAQILIDDFESGTPDTNIPNTGPWRVNDSGRPAQYRSANNPFSSGNNYAYLNDDVAAAGVAVRFMSTNATDDGALRQHIEAKVTTLSFDFWETAADIDTPAQPGLAFGYYSPGATGTGIDLNAANRTFRAFLHNGLLSPDAQVSDTGVPVAYDREKVHTVYMVANDTPTAVTNYHEGQTLDPSEADVWISLDGAAPTYAFSVMKQNPSFGPWGVGFRTFTLDIEEFLLDNVLLVDGASFDRSVFNTPGGLDGDYNGDETVNAADYTVWRDTFGQAGTGLAADGNNNDQIDDGDYDVWKTTFGQSGSGLTAVSVPEPSVAALLLAAACISFRRHACRER